MNRLRDSRTRSRARIGPAFLVATATALACGTPTGDKVLIQAALPGTYTDAKVTFYAERAGYLDAAIETGGIIYRFFFAASDVCRAIVRDGATVRYAQAGPMGRVASGDQQCDVVGVLSLREWRNRRGRAAGGTPVPRAQANYEVVYRDPDVVMARGRFPLVSRVGIAGGQDQVAVFAAEPNCERVLESRVATMEYRNGGRYVLTLVAEDGLCPILGIAMPLANERPEGETDPS